MSRIKNLLVGIIVVAVMMASLVPFVIKADPVEFLYGDVNNDQQLTANDALLILQYSVDKITLTDIQIVKAKVGNKDTVSASDALLVLQASVEKITPDDFPSGRSGTFMLSESSDSCSSDAYSSDIVSSDIVSSDVVSSEVVSSDAESSEVTSVVVSSDVASSDVVSSDTVSSDVVSSDVVSSDVVSSDIVSSDVVSSDVVSSDVVSSDVVSSDVVTSVVASSDVESSDVVSLDVESSDVVSSDVVSSNVASSDVVSSDVDSSTVPIPLELTPVSEEDYWSYNQLSEVQKNYYNLIVQGVSTRTTDYIRMGNRYIVKQADVRFAYFAVQKDHPELFYMPLSYVFLSQGMTAYISICYDNNDYYLYNAEEVATITPLLKAKIQAIYDEVLAGGMNEYEMALALHDWIANNTTYYTDAAEDPASYPEAWSAANVLVGNQKGVCEGLARAYQLLLYNCGINCILVSGEGNGGAHMWNLVELDGQWYETDVTWDDQDIENHPFHFFYNQTTDVMSALHTRAVNISDVAPADFLTIRSYNYNIPVCTATTDNYFVKNNTFFLNSEEFEAGVPALIAANVEAGKNYLDVMIDGEVFNVPADTSTYITSDLIQAANELINEPYSDITGYGVLINPGACGFTIVWS